MSLSRELKAHVLLKHNIDSLLRGRGQSRRELARFVLRTMDKRADSWVSHIFRAEAYDSREIQMKYLDRIADFFGVATYQLFQPGISPLTERRSGSDRRSWKDRRISQAVLSQKPGDVDLVDLARALTRTGREKAIRALGDILNDELLGPQTTELDPGPPHQPDGTTGARRVQKRKQR